MSMQSWSAIASTLILGFLAMSSGWRPFYVLAYAMLILCCSAWLWTRASLRGIVVAHARPNRRPQVGQPFVEETLLENRSHLPKPWLRLIDVSAVPGHPGGFVTSLGSKTRVIHKVQGICSRHGRYRLGPAVVESGDPFGLFTRRMIVDSAEGILVLPRVIPISRLALLDAPRKEMRHRPRVASSAEVQTIRPYVAGDAPGRVHGRSSARYGRLMVKELASEPAAEIWLVLDMDARVHQGAGEHSTEEYAVTIAATILTYVLRSGKTVGLISTAPATRQVGRGPREETRLLEHLAQLHAGPGQELASLLTSARMSPPPGSHTIVITPADASAWHDPLLRLQARGIQASVVALD